MPRYILTRKNTVGFRENGKLTLFRHGEEIPEKVYRQLPARVQGYIDDVAPQAPEPGLQDAANVFKAAVIPDPEKIAAEETEEMPEAAKPKRKKKQQ